MQNEFIQRLTTLIEEQISNEQFGVSELAAKAGMSRSNLLRRIKKQTGLSASQFIRQVRLENAMQLLQEEELTVSEIAYRVGFNSTSYFIKCFHDLYGHPPGEIKKQGLPESGMALDQDPVSGVTSFWNELKRRKVIRVVTVYAAAAFVILELADIVTNPLGLPDWTLNLIIILLVVGFILAVILSWVYDVTPQGIERTGSAGIRQGAASRERTGPWKTASYISFVVIIALILFNVIPGSGSGRLDPDLERSIAVLPFINESNDSTNVYFINGLMESITNDLQKIEDLRVISRTSVEKYRQSSKTIPEIAGDLQVSYFVAGSGQKLGDQIFLNIQLIEAHTDRQLWSEQYIRESRDIFRLQIDVAKSIAGEIEAIVTPEEEQQIENIPTDDLVAYDLFLQGMDHFYDWSYEGIQKAIPFFQKAIERDPEFARALANLSISYSFLDFYMVDKSHLEEINMYADRALLSDPQLPQSLIAKAMSHMVVAEFEQALPFLEKAEEYHPNSALVINILSDFYTRHMPDPDKYLEYALKGIKLNASARDSTEGSFTYLHLSSALVQTGFVEEAEMYVEISRTYDPLNLYAWILQAYIRYARNGDLGESKEMLLEALEMDPSRYDIVRELGLVTYYMRDYVSSYNYYKQLLETKSELNIDVYRGENAKIGLVYAEVGEQAASEELMADYLVYANNDGSGYRDLSLSVYHSFQGERELALSHLEKFSEQESFTYWIVLFLEIDPLFDPIKEDPRFHEALRKIKFAFWNHQKVLKDELDEKGLF